MGQYDDARMFDAAAEGAHIRACETVTDQQEFYLPGWIALTSTRGIGQVWLRVSSIVCVSRRIGASPDRNCTEIFSANDAGGTGTLVVEDVNTVMQMILVA